MKTKKPWERGFIPPRPVKIEPETPAGWTLAAKLNNCRVYTYIGGQAWGPQAEIRGIHNNWAIWYKATPWIGSLPSDNVIRKPDMRAGSLEALAVWWQIEQENLPKLEWDPAANGTVTGRRVGKSLLHGMTYKMGATAFSQLAKVRSDPRLMESMDFSEVESKLIGKEFDYVVIHDEVQVHVKQSGDRATDRRLGDQ